MIFDSEISRELQELIDKIDSADSPFREDAFKGTTDATVYPSSSASEGPETKKRKHSDGAGAHVASNSTTNARYSELMHTNGQLNQLHEIIKRECDAVIQSCVNTIISRNSPASNLASCRTK